MNALSSPDLKAEQQRYYYYYDSINKTAVIVVYTQCGNHSEETERSEQYIYTLD